MAALLVLLKALMGVYGHGDDDLEGFGSFERKKLDGSKNGEFEFLSSCVTMEDGGDKELEIKEWKLLGKSCLWP